MSTLSQLHMEREPNIEGVSESELKRLFNKFKETGGALGSAAKKALEGLNKAGAFEAASTFAGGGARAVLSRPPPSGSLQDIGGGFRVAMPNARRDSLATAVTGGLGALDQQRSLQEQRDAELAKDTSDKEFRVGLEELRQDRLDDRSDLDRKSRDERSDKDREARKAKSELDRKDKEKRNKLKEDIARSEAISIIVSEEGEDAITGNETFMELFDRSERIKARRSKEDSETDQFIKKLTVEIREKQLQQDAEKSGIDPVLVLDVARTVGDGDLAKLTDQEMGLIAELKKRGFSDKAIIDQFKSKKRKTSLSDIQNIPTEELILFDK